VTPNRGLGRTRRALEGMPLKLMIMALVISLAAPAVWGALSSFQDNVVESSLRTEAERLAAAMTDTLLAGEGNVRTIQVSLPGSAARGDGHISLGGESATDQMSVRCWLDGRRTFTAWATDPPARAIAQGGELTIGPGETTVVLSCVREDGSTFLRAEAWR